jgi:hypothetical protein
LKRRAPVENETTGARLKCLQGRREVVRGR